MLYLSLGLGQVLMMGRDLNDMSEVIAVMLLIIALGWMIDSLFFRTLERFLQLVLGIDTRLKVATAALANSVTAVSIFWRRFRSDAPSRQNLRHTPAVR